jgi:RHS repeat-associated protein
VNSVVVSGWQVFDNKGRVIEKYEPFFSQGFDYEPEAIRGQHATLFYDPRGNVIRTLNPDGSQQRVILGRSPNPLDLVLDGDDLESLDVPDSFEPTPWETYTYDANDLAPLCLKDGTSLASRAPVAHHFTPSSGLIDALGRSLCQVQRNGSDPAKDWFVTRTDYDLRGNALKIIDAHDRAAFQHSYDLLNRPLRVDSIDAGLRTSVLDAQGNLIEYRDSKGSLVRRTYDPLNRPKELWARNDTAGRFTLRERIRYGDEGDRAVARQSNTLGKPVQHYDEAGLLEMPEYDFKGNLLEKSRRTIRDDVLASVWQAEWEIPNADDVLEVTAYQTSSRYDALNRPTEVTYPQDVAGQRQQLIPRYNRSGALEAVALGDADYVQRIAYNAKGQRVLIAYGNGVMTRHTYDEQTFRLARLLTEGFTRSEDVAANTQTWRGSGPVLQDFSYSYDLAGNITAIDERVTDCGVLNSAEGRDRLLRNFSYDPIYRLLSATGRASNTIGVPRPTSDDPWGGFYAGGAATATQTNAPELTEGYTETFRYDPAGNMLELSCQAASGNWKRRFGMDDLANNRWMAATNNRLTSLESGGDTQNYQFDANGNLIQQNSEKYHAWDHADRMIGYRVQAGSNSPASIEARYLYGADGMRVKKWVRNQQSQVNTTVYVDGAFEHHRQGGGANDGAENNTLHVMDNQSRIALVRVGAALDARDVSPLVQYHLGDHLGSSHVMVGGGDAAGNSLINREEYFPYGETSFGSFGRKRYRYSGKERDEESGLYYYGARYYASYLNRWISCDPLGANDQKNLFLFIKCNPILFLDPTGKETKPNEKQSTLDRFIDAIPIIGKTEKEKKDTGDRPGLGVRLSAKAALPALGLGLNLLSENSKYDLAIDFLKHYTTGRGEDLDFSVPEAWQKKISEKFKKPGIYKEVDPYEWGLYDLRNTLGHFDLEVKKNVDGGLRYIVTDRYTFGYKEHDKNQTGRHGFQVPGLSDQKAEIIQKLLPDDIYDNPGGFKEKFELKKVRNDWTLLIPQQFLADWGVDFNARGEFTVSKSQLKTNKDSRGSDQRKVKSDQVKK